MREYEESERIAEIAAPLIEKYHQHLKGASIAYLMKKLDPEADTKPPKPPRLGKHPKVAKARAVPAVYRLLTGHDFIIEADEQRWDRLSIEQQEAAIDHELMHCSNDESGFYLKDHDVEEFEEILERHGFWKPGLERFVAAAAQRKLPFEATGGNGDASAGGEPGDPEGQHYPERKGKRSRRGEARA